MLVLLQGIINSLDNEVKLSRMECFSSPSISLVTRLLPSPPLSCPLAPSLLPYSNQPKSYFVCVHCAHTDLSVAWTAFLGLSLALREEKKERKKTNKSKMPALLSPCWGLHLNRSHGFTWGEDNTMEMEPCFCNIGTDYEGNGAERPLEPLMSL